MSTQEQGKVRPRRMFFSHLRCLFGRHDWYAVSASSNPRPRIIGRVCIDCGRRDLQEGSE